MLQLIIQGTLAIMAINIVVVLYFIQRKAFAPRRAMKHAQKQKRSEELIDMLYNGNGHFALSPRIVKKLKKHLNIEFFVRQYDNPRYNDRQRLHLIFELLGFKNPMLKMLSSRFWWKQALAADLVGKTQHQDAVPALLELIKKSKNLDVILNCGEALLQIDGKGHYCIVLDCFTQSHLISYRQILTILLNIRSEKFHDNMLDQAREQALYRRLALEALSAHGDRRVIPLIEESLTESYKEIIISALKAVDNLKLPVNQMIEDRIVGLQDHEEWAVRSFVAKVFLYCGDSSYLSLQSLMRDSNWYVRYNAAVSLSKRGDSGCLCLGEMLADEDRFARDMAWQILHLMDRTGLAESTNVHIDGQMLKYQSLTKPGVIPT